MGEGGASEVCSRFFLRSAIAWICFGAIATLTLLSMLSSQYGWPLYLEIFSHFQLQYAILILLLLCVLWATRSKSLFLTGLLLWAIVFAQVAPWCFPAPQVLLPQIFSPQLSNQQLSTPKSSGFRVFSANVNTQNTRYEQVLSLVRKESPDLAIFMEVSDPWVAQLNTLSDILPYSFGQANPYNSGLVVFSRNQLINPSLEFFDLKGPASVLAGLEINAQRVFLVATHPLPPSKPTFFNLRNQQLAQVNRHIKTLTSSPVLLVGDLNLTMWSPYYRKLIEGTGLKNARTGFGILPSWPTAGTYPPLPSLSPLLFSIPIDHCFHSPTLQVRNIRTGPANGSDHRPLIVDFF
jgi:endonuclease/exonuclease/phosphatase (EEP) superfamily protein YafD